MGVRQPAHNTGTSGGSASGGGAGSTSGGGISAGGGGGASGGGLGGGVVSAVPDGPPVPSGGWSVEYADGFGECSINTQTQCANGMSRGDNTYWPNTSTTTCTSPRVAGNEIDSFTCSNVLVDSNGLELICNGSSNPHPCGAYQTGGSSIPSGYKLFRFEPADKETWVFQIVAKWPPNNGVGDTNFWSGDPTWTNFEIDFYEAWGFGTAPGAGWCANNAVITDPTWGHPNGSAFTAMSQATEDLCSAEGFDPSSGLHTYTTEIFPNGTMSEYIDGHLAHSGNNANPLAQVSTGPATAYGGLLAQNAMKANSSNPSYNPFSSGSTTYTIRSIAVYENTTANGANTINGGTIAPGTQIH
jgi:hypothetical protein